MSNRSIFLFGFGAGAWVNIWPPAITPFAGFVFAYAALFFASWYYAVKDTRNGTE